MPDKAQIFIPENWQKCVMPNWKIRLLKLLWWRWQEIAPGIIMKRRRETLMSNEKQREPKYPGPNLPTPENNLPITDDNLPVEAVAPAQPSEFCIHSVLTPGCESCELKRQKWGIAAPAQPVPPQTIGENDPPPDPKGNWMGAPATPSPVLTPTISGDLGVQGPSLKRDDKSAQNSHPVLTQPSARELADKKLSIAYEEEGRWRIEYTTPDGAIISFNNRMVAEQARVQVRGMLGEFRAEAERPILPVPHSWKFCKHCDTWMVVCGTCGNNSCNGGYGQDGNCPDCPEAYRLQKFGWDLQELARSSSPAVTPGKNSPSAPDLKAEWMAQDKILDYTNWLQSELLKARASAPAVAHMNFRRDPQSDELREALRLLNQARIVKGFPMELSDRIGMFINRPPMDNIAAPAVAGRTQGDVSALQVIEALERGGGLTADQEKLIEKFRRQIAGAALRESARETSGLLPRSDQQLIIKALATLQVTSPVESADHTAAKALLLKVTKSLREASPVAPAAKEKI